MLPLAECPHGIRALLSGDAGRQAVLDVNGDGEGGAERSVVDRDHWRKMQPARLLCRQRRANDPAAVADDEGHLLGRAELRAARIRSPSFSRSSSSVTMTISPRAKAWTTAATGLSMSAPCSANGFALEKIVRGDGAACLGDDALSGLARNPRAMFPADEGHRAGRNADPAREICACEAISLKPLAELHAGSIPPKGLIATQFRGCRLPCFELSGTSLCWGPHLPDAPIRVISQS